MGLSIFTVSYWETRFGASDFLFFFHLNDIDALVLAFAVVMGFEWGPVTVVRQASHDHHSQSAQIWSFFIFLLFVKKEGSVDNSQTLLYFLLTFSLFASFSWGAVGLLRWFSHGWRKTAEPLTYSTRYVACMPSKGEQKQSSVNQPFAVSGSKNKYLISCLMSQLLLHIQCNKNKYLALESTHMRHW